MILTDEEVDKRLSSEDNLINQLPVKNELVEIRAVPKGGRVEGATNIPPLVRAMLGSLSNSGDETDTDIAETFGVSQPTVSNAGRGLVDKRFDSPLAQTVNKVKDARLNTAHELALDSLVDTLQRIKPALEHTLKATDLAKVAQGMGKVIEHLNPNKDIDDTRRPQVIIFCPDRKKETDYEIIEVGAN